MGIISLNEINKLNFNNISEDEIIEISASLAYHYMNGNISIDDLKKYSNSIVNIVNCIVNQDRTSNYFIKANSAMSQLLKDNALDSSSEFSLEEFLKKPDVNKPFKIDCSYNRSSYKAALGYIMPNKAIYCDVVESNHAAMVTAYHRRENPNFEDLGLWQFFHPEQPDWHEEIMEKESAIIIHFMPNEFGEAIFIPKLLTEFQYNELLKINRILLQNGIKTETNYDGMDLDTALSDDSFKERHGLTGKEKQENFEGQDKTIEQQAIDDYAEKKQAYEEVSVSKELMEQVSPKSKEEIDVGLEESASLTINQTDNVRHI